MIELPDPSKAFFYEDNFLLSCNPSRLAKIFSLYEAYKMALPLTGILVECGTFKGASFSIFAILRSLLESENARKLVAFDTFSQFANTSNVADQRLREEIEKKAGLNCITDMQLRKTLEMRCCGLEQDIELIPGDICETVPRYIEQHVEVQICLLSIDVDFGEPTKIILEHLFPKVVSGGVVLFDDYGVFEGETQVVDEFITNGGYALKRFSFSKHPWYLIKE